MTEKIIVNTGEFPSPPYFENVYFKRIKRSELRVIRANVHYWHELLENMVVYRVNGENAFFLTGKGNCSQLYKFLKKEDIDFFDVTPAGMTNVYTVLSTFGKVIVDPKKMYYFNIKLGEKDCELYYCFE